MKTFPLDNYQASSILHDISSNLLIIGTSSGELLQYDLSNNQITKSIKTTLFQINSLIQSKNSMIYAGGSSSIQQFNQHLELLSELKDHNDSVIGLGLFENTLISASEDNSVRKWLPNKSLILYSHDSPLIAFDLSSSLSSIATSCSDSVLMIYSLESNKIIKKIDSLSEKIWSLKFVSKNSTLITGDHSGSITIRKFPEFQEIQKISLHESRVKGLAVSLDERFFLSCSFDQKVLVFQTDDNKNVYKFEEHQDWVRAITTGLKDSQGSSWFYRKTEKVYSGFSVADDKSVGIFEFQRECLVDWNFWILAILAGLVISVLVYYIGLYGILFNYSTAPNPHQDLVDSDQKFLQNGMKQEKDTGQKKEWGFDRNINQDLPLDGIYSQENDLDERKLVLIKNLDESTENFKKSTENFNKSTENFNKSTENFNQSTENFNQSTENLNENHEFNSESLLITQDSFERIQDSPEFSHGRSIDDLDSLIDDALLTDSNTLKTEPELGQALLQLTG